MRMLDDDFDNDMEITKNIVIVVEVVEFVDMVVMMANIMKKNGINNEDEKYLCTFPMSNPFI